MSTPTVGQKAPALKLTNQDNNLISLSEIKSKWVLIYFYPKAMTSGCTVQACALRDAKKELAARDVTVLGISPDKTKELKAFEAKDGLNFTLLGDPEHKVAEAYGVWVEKSMYGKKYMGMARTSFLVDNKGIIRLVLPKVDPQTHLDEVLRWLDSQAAAA